MASKWYSQRLLAIPRDLRYPIGQTKAGRKLAAEAAHRRNVKMRKRNG